MFGSLVNRVGHEEMRTVDGLSEPPLDLAPEIAPSEAAGDLEHGALDRAYPISPLHDRWPG